MDLFEYGGRTYLITVDYQYRWVEIKLLPTQTAKCVIAAAKELFATHGIPDTVISDNGPVLVQYPSKSLLPSMGLSTRPALPDTLAPMER